MPSFVAACKSPINIQDGPWSPPSDPFLVDLTAPAATISVADKNLATKRHLVPVDLTVVDPAPTSGAASGVAKVVLSERDLAAYSPGPGAGSRETPIPPGLTRYLVTLPEGHHEISVQATDRAGNLSGVATTQVLVDTTGPRIVFQQSARRVPVGQVVAFDADGTSDSGSGLALPLRWGFGDGSGAIGMSPVHAFLRRGTFCGRVTARDNLGNVASHSFVVRAGRVSSPRLGRISLVGVRKAGRPVTLQTCVAERTRATITMQRADGRRTVTKTVLMRAGLNATRLVAPTGGRWDVSVQVAGARKSIAVVIAPR
jgi:PKD domain